jgi:hypothetical protein
MYDHVPSPVCALSLTLDQGAINVVESQIDCIWQERLPMMMESLAGREPVLRAHGPPLVLVAPHGGAAGAGRLRTHLRSTDVLLVSKSI